MSKKYIYGCSEFTKDKKCSSYKKLREVSYMAVKRTKAEEF